MEENTQQWIEEAREMAAQCWCTPETSGIEMDTRLAEVFASTLANWMDTGAQAQRNADYYRGLVVRCGKSIGPEAYIQDDGGVVDEVLCAKVPELVEELVSKKYR